MSIEQEELHKARQQVHALNTALLIVKAEREFLLAQNWQLTTALTESWKTARKQVEIAVQEANRLNGSNK